MSSHIVEAMLEEMKILSQSTEEVFKFHATTLIEDFRLPAGYVVDMMHSLRAAVSAEHAE